MVKSRYAPAGIIAAIIAVVTVFPAAASASTRAFTIWNDSSRPIVLTSDGHGDDLDGPALGTVLQPGTGLNHFEAGYVFVTDTTYVLTYGYGTDKNAATVVTFNLTVGHNFSASMTCTVSGGGACGEQTDAPANLTVISTTHLIP